MENGLLSSRVGPRLEPRRQRSAQPPRPRQGQAGSSEGGGSWPQAGDAAGASLGGLRTLGVEGAGRASMSELGVSHPGPCILGSWPPQAPELPTSTPCGWPSGECGVIQRTPSPMEN